MSVTISMKLKASVMQLPEDSQEFKGALYLRPVMKIHVQTLLLP